ncbi:hypothetical protein HPB52_000338 [Rhipicephalus sanguineus]|uniref:Uncharacterized protein n=1 Tax=Rhipicephalus sanguineus TaxID=34632 RepID=A0A9D4T4V2_RHISA|nr:hypothetical protein HPB52_000338 [Rhipicephalus sanguineus]
MEPEVQARANLPVVLVNREGLYVIIGVMSASILGCACVLAYSLSNYDKLRKNAEEVRNYIAHHGSRAPVREHSGGEYSAAAGGVGTSDARSVTIDTPNAMASANESRIGADPSLGAGRNTSDFASVVRSVSDTFAVAAKQVSGADASEAQLSNAASSDGGGGAASSSSAGGAASTHDTALPGFANVSWNREGRNVNEAD